jgi:hypothetical protein
MSASPETGKLFNAFLALNSKDRAAFIALVKGTGAVGKTKAPYAPDRPQMMLYDQLAAKLFSYRGIKLLPLSALRGTSAEEELTVAVKWLQAGRTLSRDEMNGLIELASEAAATEIPWGAKHERVDARATVMRLALIPSSVDRAFPGYQKHGMLFKVAAAISGGKLPIAKVLHWD